MTRRLFQPQSTRLGQADTLETPSVPPPRIQRPPPPQGPAENPVASGRPPPPPPPPPPPTSSRAHQSSSSTTLSTPAGSSIPGSAAQPPPPIPPPPPQSQPRPPRGPPPPPPPVPTVDESSLRGSFAEMIPTPAPEVDAAPARPSYEMWGLDQPPAVETSQVAMSSAPPVPPPPPSRPQALPAQVSLLMLEKIRTKCACRTLHCQDATSGYMYHSSKQPKPRISPTSMLMQPHASAEQRPEVPAPLPLPPATSSATVRAVVINGTKIMVQATWNSWLLSGTTRPLSMKK